MVHVEDHGAVRVLLLDREDRLNAFDHQQYGALADAVEDADVDPAVHVLVLTGAGRAFSSGADLQALADPASAASFQETFDRMLDALAAFKKPVIAAVNGLAVGIGATVLLHCDLVLADAAARFRTPFPQLATTPEAASSFLLPRAVGVQAANWMLLTGEWVDADWALRTGLVAQVYPAGTVLDEAIEVARRMSECAPEALAAAKALVREGVEEQGRRARARELAAARALSTAGVVSGLWGGRPPQG